MASLKIVAIVHYYPPYRNAGSERMIHAMLAALAREGHDVQVVVTAMPEAEIGGYWFDGIEVIPGSHLKAGVLDPDVLISHHENARLTVGMARVMGCKSVIILHNDFPQSKNLLRMSPDLTVFNTEWLKKKFKVMCKGRNTLVFHPPVWVHEHYVNEVGSKVTLVNLNKDKGSELFYRLAERMEGIEFLGVIGAHGDQMLGGGENVEIMTHTEDMRLVWAKTKVLVVPSVYESYGMVGPEAMASGIPVIATPTPGLKESLGSAGIFLSRGRRDDWQWEINRLMTDEEYWQEWSGRSIERSDRLDPTVELTEWVKAVEEL